MRTSIQALITTIAVLAVPATASADFGHVVAPGESLTSVAAADGLSVSQLAAANGLSPNANLIAGSTIQIPPQSGVGSAPGEGAAPSEAGEGTESSQAAQGTESSPTGEGAPAASAPAGGLYVVQPGDTLSAIAAANGMAVDQLAADNGLDPNGVLLAGSTLSFGGGSAASSGQPETTGVPGTGAQPTAETVSPGEVGQVAAVNGVPASLAEAVGYQESGFNNDLVSSTGATGVMQIEPATWNYIQQDLAGPPPLSASSAADNIRGGVLLLRSLLAQTGGNASMAAAGYYQGLPSIERNGIFPSTQQYVNDVMALQHQFGGP